MTRIAQILIIALALLGCRLPVGAQSGGYVDVAFVNIYPGSEIYELEGHSALRVRDGERDIAVSYGTFDFNAPNFVYRYVKGETDYWVSVMPWHIFEAEYVHAGRRMVEHPVLLDSAQTERFMQLLSDNLRPENRVYRYNYVRDNCALRPLRLVEAAVGAPVTLPQPTDGSESDMTYRQMMRRYHSHYPWYQFGIDLALGSGLDRKITAEEKAFSPVTLDTQLPGAMAGGRHLTGTPVVINAGRGDATLPPTPWLLSPMAVALLVLVITAAVTWRDQRRRKVTRWFDAVMFGVFGLAGSLLTFLIFVSVHEATSPNWLYLWLNPLCLIVPIFIWLKKQKNVVFSYQIVNFALIFVMVVAWPWLGQSANAAFWPLIAADALRAASYISLTINSRRNNQPR